MQSISEFLKRNTTQTVKIAVVGDSILDEYYSVKVTRISPEFPTQIMHSPDWNPAAIVPGGAANVCFQMANGFNVESHLLSLIDNRSVSVFERQPFRSDRCVVLKDKETHMPIKRRFYDGDYPLPRWDIESPLYGYTPETLKPFQDALFDNLCELMATSEIDMVVLSDYGKGLFTNGFSEKVISYCNLHETPTIVDPKDPPIERWMGCTYFKPNAFECCKITGLPHGDWWKHQRHLIEKYNIPQAIITDGPNPPFLPVQYGGELSLAREPDKQSVIGAGDCFCAFLAMSLAQGMILQDSVEVAWNASSLYIESRHNKPIMPHEFAKWNEPLLSKIVTVEEMVSISKYDKCKWIWTNGVFDMLHSGHLKTLEIAKKMGGKVIVGLNADESVRKLKGPDRPINNYTSRAEHLAHCQYVDFIVPIEEETPLSIIEKLIPHTIVKGGDYCKEEVVGSSVVGIDNVVIVPLTEGVSTTKIIERIKHG
jgi:D-beta-D-heptose 7-phosphate kinase/D-beta-D-heptose 1-phosphate adenosyltransferase